MLFVLLAVAVIGVAIAVVPMITSRDRGLDEVARFHRARQMTTEWSRAGVTRPVFADDAAAGAAVDEESVH